MRGLLLGALAALPLAACVAPQAAPPPPSIAAPPPISPGGLEAVMGATAQRLIAQFGNPDLDLREGPARKLQFLAPACVLDAYLYPPRGGRGEPVVTHVDARQPDGRDMDRASCVAALTAERQNR
ncbi:hypothetical protein [Sphingosinicella sp.]|uniref:hypothetical protein n=1 Tax=Sphingosinicella sp. TaxID=1917971 RepID=UPI004037E9C6